MATIYDLLMAVEKPQAKAPVGCPKAFSATPGQSGIRTYHSVESSAERRARLLKKLEQQYGKKFVETVDRK